MPNEYFGMKFYTTEEVKNLFGVTEATVRNYIRSGNLKAKKIAGKYYILEQNLKDFLLNV